MKTKIVNYLKNLLGIRALEARLDERSERLHDRISSLSCDVRGLDDAFGALHSAVSERKKIGEAAYLAVSEALNATRRSVGLPQIQFAATPEGKVSATTEDGATIGVGGFACARGCTCEACESLRKERAEAPNKTTSAASNPFGIGTATYEAVAPASLIEQVNYIRRVTVEQSEAIERLTRQIAVLREIQTATIKLSGFEFDTIPGVAATPAKSVLRKGNKTVEYKL